MRSPQTTGLEWARPGIAVFQRMFFAFGPFQVSGRFWPSATPLAFGPRKDGQLPFAGAAAGSVGATSGPVRTILRSGTGTVALMPSRATVSTAGVMTVSVTLTRRSVSQRLQGFVASWPQGQGPRSPEAEKP